ncbi:MAG TPA: AAA family ATPase [Candidatus Aquilonibacter sp.]|jgi:general secretion pathway protein A|nr:AAA family ATPase [Candidatus Aquilonibacter sp.]
MYKAFYNLKRNPFEITPDPSFLFPTRRHNEALAALYYGVRRHKGFVVLTGEVGTGKTLLLRCLLQLLKQSDDVKYAYVFNGRLSPLEFLQYIAGDLGLPTAGKNKSDLLLQLAGYVVRRGEKKLTTVLVVDEAHHLSTDILEEIRLLTNLETADAKLLQILLVGQPELDEKLDSVDLRQLKQRIALRSHLASLDLNETKGYIERRLQLAGSPEPAEIFPHETVAAIHRYSRGIPRLINTICENALVAAYARQLKSVTEEIIEGIATDFRLGIQTPKVEKNPIPEDMDLQNVARKLIALYTQLQSEPVR